jgi:hypothetical protein
LNREQLITLQAGLAIKRQNIRPEVCLHAAVESMRAS